MRDGQEEDEAPHTAGGSGCRAHPEGSRWGCGRRPGRGRPQWSARLGTLSPDTRSFPCAATATAPPGDTQTSHLFFLSPKRTILSSLPPAPRQTPTPSPAPGRVSGGLAAYLCRYSWRAEGPHPPPGSASLRRHRAPAGGTGPIPARRPQRGRRLRPAARCPHPLHGLGAAGTLGSVGSPADYIPLRALLLLRAALLQPPPLRSLLPPAALCSVSEVAFCIILPC